MRSRPTSEMESFRVYDTDLYSDQFDTFGLFRGVYRGERLQIIASDGKDWLENDMPPPAWEHVSVRGQGRCPLWDHLAWVKDQFWLPEECVLQFHVPQAMHINIHPHVLHLWRPIGVEIPLPPKICV